MRCDSECPIQGFVALFAGKWSLPVLHTLIDSDGPIRFGEIRKHVGPVTQKELAKTLREFENRGLATRTVFAEVPPRVEYEAADFARSLSVPLEAIKDWAVEHRERLIAIADERDAAMCDPDRMVA